MKNITVVDNHPPDKYRDLYKENIFLKKLKAKDTAECKLDEKF